MAQHQLGPVLDDTWVDKRRSGTAAISTGNITTPANFASISALDARLAAVSGTKYTAPRLQTMTVNDKVYALRVEDEAAGV